ncbi:MAG: hypothetical protein ACRDL4_19455, partial [Thermoleophilaceae bacterium]
AGQARKRLADAIKFLEVAELVDDEPIHVSTGVSASLAVLAGIAAADAACCAAHGRRSRGDRHEDAAKLISRVQPGGKTAAVTFGRLLRVKDDAQYGLMSVRPPARDTALRHARKLVDFAARIVEATR